MEEQSLLQDLMKATQIEVFEKSKLSMKEYGDAMNQYEERLSRVLQDTVIYETKKKNLLKIKSKYNKLSEEKERLRITMAKAQKDYITSGKYETRVYENMLKSYSERLTEIEEKLALLDAKNMQKTGRLRKGAPEINKTKKINLKKEHTNK